MAYLAVDLGNVVLITEYAACFRQFAGEYFGSIEYPMIENSCGHI